MKTVSDILRVPTVPTHVVAERRAMLRDRLTDAIASAIASGAPEQCAPELRDYDRSPLTAVQCLRSALRWLDATCGQYGLDRALGDVYWEAVHCRPGIVVAADDIPSSGTIAHM